MNDEEKNNLLAPDNISPTRTGQPVDPNGTLPSSAESAPQSDVPPLAVETVFVKKRQSFFAERPLPVIEMAPRVLRYRFHFFGLSHPVWAKNNAGKRFYSFLNFFTIFL